MKSRIFAWLLALGLLSGAAIAADNKPSTYFGGTNSYFLIPSSNTNFLDQGLVTGKVYVVFALTNLVDLTAGQAHSTTGDVRAVMYGILERYYETWTATASTNQSQSSVTRTPQYDHSGSTNLVRIIHAVRTTYQLGTGTLP